MNGGIQPARVAVIAGASHGIGRGIACSLASDGLDIAFCYAHDQAGAEETAALVRSIGRRALPFRADIADSTEVRSFIAATVDAFGRIDVLVNNAAILEIHPLLDLPDDSWRRVLGVNLDGYFYCAREAARHMVSGSRGGRIINIGSVLGEWPLAGRSSYSASKGAIVALTKIWALELAPYQITVNTVEPGTILSEMTAPMLRTDEERAAAAVPIPIGRIGFPEDIGAVVAFLASPAAGYVTGVSMLVDGGLSISSAARGETGFPADWQPPTTSSGD